MNTSYNATEYTIAKVRPIDCSRSNCREIRIPISLVKTLEAGDAILIYNGVSFDVAIIIDLNIPNLTNSIIDYIAICKMDIQNNLQSYIKQIRLKHIKDDITAILNASDNPVCDASQLRKLWSEFNILSQSIDMEE